ncbi:LysR family transcriptional regulator [Brevibacillus fulvus]|uniref:DNA-binding transcriptional LysR family regulator n=1 Tax=Brevibacillus fulvus TaxID=1125967 RepID=A0A938XWI6_9BACL|nr:LysR family transcriptional regulator [Brevibacillus fulvus]MBM7588995.1 DNA-binding transcriptional LysR family regulator [Brevibacillus fulvus]
MDWKTLKTFQVIVQSGSFMRAAEELNYVQSTVTMQIQKLEAELGVQLIERGKKSLRLTEAGRLLYEQSLPIVKSMERLTATLAELQSGEGGEIRLGATEPTASYRLPSLLAMFLADFPKIKLSVDIANTPRLTDQLRKGELDLAVCFAPDLSPELYYEPLLIEEFVLLLAEDHPLAAKENVTLADLGEYRLLITAKNCPYRRKLEMVLQENGAISIETMEIGSMTALPHYVANGLGIALVPKILVQPVPAGTVIRTVNGDLLGMSFGIVSRPSEHSANHASLQLYHFLKRHLSQTVALLG